MSPAAVEARCSITKKPEHIGSYHRPLVPFANARSAFKALLETSGFCSTGTVLLPAFVGWSRREGSGVYDPVRETGARSLFYKVGRDLAVDLADFGRLLDGTGPFLVVLIHYYGFVSKGAKRAARMAKDRGAFVLEDQAHSLLTDWVGGATGQLGDASIYSLHKIFAVETGGALALAQGSSEELIACLTGHASATKWSIEPWQQDLHGISAIRRRNARFLLRELAPLRERIRPLWTSLPRSVVPQTLPCIVVRDDRDLLYERLNAAGFGAVSLYHTLIDAINAGSYPDSHWLSKRVINLPVHQDTGLVALRTMVRWLRNSW